VDPFAQSTIFGNLLESNYTTLPKHKLFLMKCSTSVQIYKNFEAREVFVSRVQTGISNSVPDLKFFRVLLKQVAIFEMPYLLESGELYCACQPYCSVRIVEHNGTLIVKSGAMVDL
jgi:hypothetical protein